VALKTAFATAASVGTIGGSPMPAVEVLLPRLATGVRIDCASNMSEVPAPCTTRGWGSPSCRRCCRARFSKSAHEAPWIIAPITWLCVVSGLTTMPQSLTETIFTTRTTPVPVSTSTSANCVPARSPR
jgi:hypothetical protein